MRKEYSIEQLVKSIIRWRPDDAIHPSPPSEEFPDKPGDHQSHGGCRNHVGGVMGSQQDAVKATQMFNGYNLDDREIKVGTAHERDNSGRGGYDNNRGTGRPPAHKSRGGARRY